MNDEKIAKSHKIMPVEHWETMVTKIPPARKGRFAIFKRLVQPGDCSQMNDVFGYEEVCFLIEASITLLYEGNKEPRIDPEGIWMSDAPAEYYGMHELAARAKSGRVLVGGLGLGILPNLLAFRDDITEVVIVEKSPEVVELVKAYLHPKVKLIEGDFLQEMPKLKLVGQEFQTVIADIFKTAKEKELYDKTKFIMEDSYPTARRLFWAFQDEYDIEHLNWWLLGPQTKISSLGTSSSL